MKNSTFKVSDTSLSSLVISDNEIGEVLIYVRDICKNQNLDRTSEAIRTALNILFYETRANSGEIKFKTRAPKVTSVVTNSPKMTPNRRRDANRLKKLENLREKFRY